MHLMSSCRVWAFAVAVFLLLTSGSGLAQGPKPRLVAAISNSSRVQLPGTRPAIVTRGLDEGALAAGAPVKGMTLVLHPSDAQQADLDQLLSAQQDPTSPLYHQWLTPEQFGARFGVADADLAKIEDWLQGQGFTVDGISRSRTRITFDGTAGQVATAFGTTLHHYAEQGRVHLAPAGDLSVPAAMAPLVTTVLHVSDLHAHAQKKLRPAGVVPAYTSSQTGNHFLVPADVATMYDMKTTYSAGFNGAGQSIAILAQSYIDTAPVTAFQSALSLPSNLPTQVLVPNTGVAGINPMGDGDEGESQLDVEYTTGMAPGAKVFLVYTGDNPNSTGVFDSATYAVDNNLAPIISGSYGLCEGDLVGSNGTQSSAVAAYSQLAAQAAAQGQTMIFSSGDDGSTTCYSNTGDTTAVRQSLNADFPASIPYVTALGGTQMQAGTLPVTTASTQYWQGATGSDAISSLLSYVPETVWNEDTTQSTSTQLAASGGGVSILYPRPTWQAGVPGIPSGTTRLVPDVSLQASEGSPGYLYCTSDQSDLDTQGLTATCTNGLRSPTGTFALAGGTSFSAPIFAGMLAVLNQVKNATGQGNINPTLYALASNATTYASVFHDITTGTNACTGGVTYCSTAGASQYAATAGYDMATGLGSFDFARLVAAWPAASSGTGAQVASTVSLSAATLTPASGATDVITITVSAGAGHAVPTGTVTVYVDGSATGTPVTLSNGVATYTYPGTTTGASHVLLAKYSGDAATLPSQGAIALTLAGSTAATGTFALSVPGISLGYNGLAQGTISITPSAGYAGTVALTLTYTSGTSTATLCYLTTSSKTGASNITVAPQALQNGVATGVLQLGEGTQCGVSATKAMLQGGTKQALLHRPLHRGEMGRPADRRWPEGVAFAGLLFVGLSLRRRSRKLPALCAVVLLTGIGFGLSGCGGSNGNSTTTTNPNSTTQTITATLTGKDTVNPSISASTIFTVTVHP